MSYLIDADTLSASLGSHRAAWSADVFYAGVPTITDLALAPTGSLSTDGDARIQTTGRIYVRSDRPVLDRDGNTLAPRDLDDFLSNSGQEISVKRTVSIGSRSFPSVEMGRFKITDVPTIQETRQRLGGTSFANSVSLEIAVADMFDKLDGDDFSEPTSPVGGATVWSEIRRLSTVPVQSAVDDADVSSGVVYSTSRLDAITDLLRNIGAVPSMTRQGILTAKLIDPIKAGGYALLDLTGTIQDQTNGTAGRPANMVVVTGASSGSKQLVGTAQVRDGFLSVTGEYGRRVRAESNPNAITQSAVDNTARTYLQQELASRSRKVTITCLPRLEIDTYDVVKATDPRSGRVEIGVVTGFEFSLNPTDLMTIDLTIPEGISIS